MNNIFFYNENESENENDENIPVTQFFTYLTTYYTLPTLQPVVVCLTFDEIDMLPDISCVDCCNICAKFYFDFKKLNCCNQKIFFLHSSGTCC